MKEKNHSGSFAAIKYQTTVEPTKSSQAVLHEDTRKSIPISYGLYSVKDITKVFSNHVIWPGDL